MKRTIGSLSRSEWAAKLHGRENVIESMGPEWINLAEDRQPADGRLHILSTPPEGYPTTRDAWHTPSLWECEREEIQSSDGPHTLLGETFLRHVYPVPA